MNKKASLVVWSAFLLVSMTIAGDPRWDVPQIQPPSGPLPRLATPVNADGRLDEWSGALSLLIRSESCIAHRNPSHQWRGAADCSAEVLVGWTDEGLCIAANVADDDVHNDRPADSLWQQDCIEIFIDGRSVSRLRKPPYSVGAYQAFVRPPTDANPPLFAVNAAHGAIEKARIGGVRTQTGYAIELVIPWQAFPELTPKEGSIIGLQFAIDDWDSRDGSRTQPLMLSFGGATALFMSPQKLLQMTLVGSLSPRDRSLAGLAATLDAPVMVVSGETVNIRLELSRALPNVASAAFRVRDWMTNDVFETAAALAAVPDDPHSLRACFIAWPVGNAPDGAYVVSCTLLDAQNREVGSSERRILLLRNMAAEARAAIEAAIARIEAADLPALAREEPFRCLQWLSLAAAVESLKRGVETRNYNLIRAARQELACRLAIALDESFPQDAAPVYAAIQLSRIPESQVVVEYPLRKDHPEPAMFHVSFLAGSLPLAGVLVQQFPTAEDALAVLNTSQDWFIENLSAPWSKGGLSGRLETKTVRLQALDMERFDPRREVLVVSIPKKTAVALPLENVSSARAEAAAILPDSDGNVDRFVRRWARQKRVSILPLESAATNACFLIAGNLKNPRAAKLLAPISRSLAATIEEGAPRINIAVGNRLVRAYAPCAEAAETAARLVIAGAPIAPADVENIRAALSRALPPDPARNPIPDLPLFVGDVHSHTFFSDGMPSPIGLVCQAMACGLDFLVISDHNTIAGAQLAVELLASNKVAFPVTVGQEVTTSWAHMNAYPLAKPIPADLPCYEIVKQTHKQGAVIQWNHPGQGSDDAFYKQHGPTAMAGTGFDAWEHMPADQLAWRRKGVLPVLVGSTDTHSGTFNALERTAVVAPTAHGEDLAEAIRRRAVCLVCARELEYAYGVNPGVTDAVRVMIAQPDKWKAIKAERIRGYLANADIPGLLRSSPSAPPQ